MSFILANQTYLTKPMRKFEMEYEIINPSDKAFITAESFKTACIATAILGSGRYGLKGDGKTMPVLIFATGWFLDTFKQDIEEAVREIDDKLLKEAFLSVRLESKRSSLNDIVGRAKELAELLEKKGEK